MVLVAVIRYVVAASVLAASALLLGIGAIHLVAGVPAAVLPVLGGLVLAAAAGALAPVVRRRWRPQDGARDDVVLAVEAVAIAVLALLASLGIGLVS